MSLRSQVCSPSQPFDRLQHARDRCDRLDMEIIHANHSVTAAARHRDWDAMKYFSEESQRLETELASARKIRFALEEEIQGREGASGYAGGLNGAFQDRSLVSRRDSRSDSETSVPRPPPKADVALVDDAPIDDRQGETLYRELHAQYLKEEEELARIRSECGAATNGVKPRALIEQERYVAKLKQDLKEMFAALPQKAKRRLTGGGKKKRPGAGSAASSGREEVDSETSDSQVAKRLRPSQISDGSAAAPSTASEANAEPAETRAEQLQRVRHLMDEVIDRRHALQSRLRVLQLEDCEIALELEELEAMEGKLEEKDSEGDVADLE